MKLIFFVAVALTLSACGGGHNPDKDNLNKAIVVGDASYYDLGVNKGLMTEGVSSVNSGANFEYHFRVTDGGSFTVFAFANSSLTNGIAIRFTRNGGTLNVLATAQGITQDWSPLFASVDASQDVTLTMDIHNNESPAHIMIWNGSKNPKMNHTNTLYNSAEDSVDLDYDAGPGNGSGRAWGFQTDGATLINAKISDPQDSH